MSKQQRSSKLNQQEQRTVEQASESQVKDAIERQGGAKAVITRTKSNPVIMPTVGTLSAKPISNDQARGMVYVDGIIACLDGGDRGIFKIAMDLWHDTPACHQTALGTLDARQEDRIAEAEDEYPEADMRDLKQAKIASIRSSISRVRTVLKAFTLHDNGRRDYSAFNVCESFHDMVVCARQYGTQKGKNEKFLTGGGFESWLDKANRIVDIKGYKASSDTSTAQIARLEQFLLRAVVIYSKIHETVPGLRFNAEALQTIVAPKAATAKVARKHLKAA